MALSSCAPATPASTPTSIPTLIPTLPPAPTTAPARVRFEAGPCQFPVPAGKIDCGVLFVPEDRAPFDSPLIQLPVAIVRSSNSSPAPDPVVYLVGGPGGHALDRLEYLATFFKDVLASRDLIVFDQRGVGYARPSLNCPEVETQFHQVLSLNLSPEKAQQQYVQAMEACQARLVNEGDNLTAYTTAANAADVADLRVALGYPEWNIYGVSYGSRLALTAMRDYPQGIRSVVLDSVFPPPADSEAKMAENAERAFNLFFERCAVDAKCNAAYPDLKTVFYETVAQLDVTPITLTLTYGRTGKTYDAVVNGDRLIVYVFQLLYFTEALPYLPALIYDLHEARGGFMLQRFLNELALAYEFLSEGMNASVSCSLEANRASPEAVATSSAAVFPRLREAIQHEIVSPDLAVCAMWPVKPAATIESQPVTSDIPTLILAGDNDPITPPAWGQLAAQTLSHSHFFEFRWVGHAVLGAGVWGSCSQHIVSAFLANPQVAPDSACLSELKVFFVKQ